MFKPPRGYIELRDGKAYITGTGKKVGVVGRMLVELGDSVEYIAEGLNLTPAQVYAAAAYYCENQELFQKREAETIEYLHENAEHVEVTIARMKERRKKSES